MSSPSPTISLDSVPIINSLVDQPDVTDSIYISTKCTLCREIFTLPKVLPCFHTFCQPCLEKNQEHPDKIVCSLCQQEVILSSLGVSGLLSDYAISNLLEALDVEDPTVTCTGCKSKESNAVARCFDCANFLCSNCVMAHQFMHCFEGHRVLTMSELLNKDSDINVEKTVNCLRHKNEKIKYFCLTCNTPICQECTSIEHPQGLHDYEYIHDTGPKLVEQVLQLMDDGKGKLAELRGMLKNVEHTNNKLQMFHMKAQKEITDTYSFYVSMLEERKAELLKELDSQYNEKQVALNLVNQKTQEVVDKVYQTSEFVDKLTQHASTTEVLMFKKLLDSKLMAAINYNPEVGLQNISDLEFVSNYQAIQVAVKNTYGYIRSGSDLQPGTKQPPIARPNGNSTSPPLTNGHTSIPNGNRVNGNGMMNGHSQSNGHASPFESNILKPRFGSNGSLGPFPASLEGLGGIDPYKKWSNGNGDIFQHAGGGDSYHMGPVDPVIDSLSSQFLSSSIYPTRSQVKRQKMIYHCKFGEFGINEGQFTEPSGVAVNAQNDIIVADTNNHRIQIFDKEGRFKFQFGECGKRDGQLLYPNRVTVVKTSGDLIVTERSPTHQIQVYNQYGQFVRKFGANILQHPRGVTVDNKGRIIVVECKVMRVIIFDQVGTVLQKFGCSKHLEFPNGVVVNDKQEIFISDNRAHCVKVFNYEGQYLRQIGGEGLTNYPIGVGINAAGEILIADNHNNFNLTAFSQDGQLLTALESKVKHAQCFDVALMGDGSVVLASKDYRLYVYRYVQVPPLPL